MSLQGKKAPPSRLPLREIVCNILVTAITGIDVRARVPDYITLFPIETMISAKVYFQILDMAEGRD